MEMKKRKRSAVIPFYNLEHKLFTIGMTGLANFVYHLMQLVFGCSIPPSVDLEAGVDIPHFHGIVIHQDTTVGSGTVIYQNVTIGGRNQKAGATIGKNCLIAAGACILGDVKIGDNVKIGANAVVLTDIPSNCTAVGVPAKIVKHYSE
jgi:serine O-acetyltransferase